jgi:hypothetical protein
MALRAKPSSLFDDKGKRAMFVSLYSHPLIPLFDVDDQLKDVRQKFVEQCVKAAVDAAATAGAGRMVGCPVDLCSGNFRKRLSQCDFPTFKLPNFPTPFF